MLSWFFRGEFCSSDGSKVVTTQPDTSFREEIPWQKREREQLNERTVTCVVDCHVTVRHVTTESLPAVWSQGLLCGQLS